MESTDKVEHVSARAVPMHAKRRKQNSYRILHSTLVESMQVSDDAAEAGGSGGGGAGRAVDSDDEDYFLDCEPSTSLEAIERSSLVPSTRCKPAFRSCFSFHFVVIWEASFCMMVFEYPPGERAQGSWQFSSAVELAYM